MRHLSPKQRTPLREIVGNEGRDWYKQGGPICGGLLGPEYHIRIVSTGALYRVGELTYMRLLNGSKPTPDGWQEICEDGEPLEYPEDRAASAADASYQFKAEQF